MKNNELMFSNYTVEKTGVGYDCYGDVADIALCACAVSRGTYDGGAQFWFEYGIFVGDLNDIEDQCNVEPELLELEGIPAKEGEQVYEMFLNGTWYDD